MTKQLHWRRREIIGELTRLKATSPETSRFVCGSDYPLALKMVKDKQLESAHLREGHLFLSSDEYPHYTFYLKKERCI